MSNAKINKCCLPDKEPKIKILMGGPLKALMLCNVCFSGGELIGCLVSQLASEIIPALLAPSK